MPATLSQCQLSATNNLRHKSVGVNPEHVDLLIDGPLNITGSDDDGEIRVIEHPEHPFYFGTLFVPQSRSTREHLHPLVERFLETILRRSY